MNKIVRQAHRAMAALVLILVVGTAVRAQSQTDEAAVMAANNAYYAALSALDMGAMEKVWAHEDYVSQVGPRFPAPLFGWETIQSYVTKTWANFSELKVRPVDPHIRVNGNVAWIIGKEEVGSTSRLKDGTLISSRPTIVTNIFEKRGDRWLMVSHHAQEPAQ